MGRMRSAKQYFEIPLYDGPGIYAIWNLDNGKCYIGSSVNVHDRLKTHNYSFAGLWCNKKILPDILSGCRFRSEILEKLPVGVDEKVLRKHEWMHITKISPERLYNSPHHNPTITNRPKGKKEIIQAHAEIQGESVNAFINRAIDNQMKQDKKETGE